jgi:hypothetical protein
MIIALSLASSALACGSDETLIMNKVTMELDACKAATTPTHEVTILGTKSYSMETSVCKMATAGEVKLIDKMYADVPAPPYLFKLRKNMSDSRWFINQIKWPELDEARHILTWDTLSKADYDKALELFTKAEKQAPHLEEIPLAKLEILLKRRRNANKDKDPDPAGLGPVLKAYYAEVVKRASDQDNPDLNAKVRLTIIRYFDDYRVAAEEASVPSATAADWERGAIKALENDLEEAKKNKDEAETKRITEEIAVREKEMPENQKRREANAEIMAGRAKALKKYQCAELRGLAGVTPTNADLKTEVGSAKALLDCSGS